MKVKVLAVIALAGIAGLAGCRSTANTNTNTAVVTNTTTTTATVAPTAVPKTNEAGTTDPNLKSKIESALKAKGFTDVTVDTSTTPASLRGSYPKARMAEVMDTAMTANGGKPVQNQATGK